MSPLRTRYGGFFVSNYVLTWVWKNAPKMDPTCLLVLLSLADQANDEGYCWPSQKSTADRCRISPRQVQRWIDHLVDIGVLESRIRTGTSNMYRVLSLGRDTTPVSQGGTTPTTGGVRHPPRSNHQEPSLEPSVEQRDARPVCPYCKRRFDSTKRHNCSALNQLI